MGWFLTREQELERKLQREELDKRETYIREINGAWYAYEWDKFHGRVMSIGNDNPRDKGRWIASRSDEGIRYVATASPTRDAAYRKARRWGTYIGEG